MNVLVCWCFVASACSSPTGMLIEVSSSSSTKEVELFIGTDNVSDPAVCASGSGCRIVPPGVNSVRKAYDGTGWIITAAKSNRASVQNGSVQFKLEIDAGQLDDQTISALLVVGYAADGSPTEMTMLHDLVVPAGNPAKIQITLTPATTITASVGSERLQIWRRPADANASESACAVVGHADGTYEYFVPSDDTDCDGAIPNSTTAPECSDRTAWSYCGGANPNLAATTCVTPTANQAACRLGGPLCIDSGPNCPAANPCAPTNEIACLPKEVCETIAMSNPPCNSFDANCLGTGLTTTIPSANCHFFFQAGACPWPTLDATVAAGVLNGRTCLKLELALLSSPLVLGPSVQISATAALVLVPTGPDLCVQTVQVTGDVVMQMAPVLLDVVTGPAPIQHRFIELTAGALTTASCALSMSTCNVNEPGGYKYACE
jgi:hypothetical protein